MVRKLQKEAADSAGEGRKSGAQLSGTIKDSAQQIWLAGLGAFAKAQEEGGKVFEALVKEGLTMQRKTQAAAEEKISEATSRMATMATDLTSKASGQWDKLESIFEQRVSRAMGKLGVPSAKEIDELTRRVEELSRQVARLGAKQTARASTRRASTHASAGETPKPVRKRAARKSV